MVGVMCSCWSGMSDGLFWLNKEQRENEGSSRGFFELEKECIVLPGAPWHWGGSELPSVRTNTVGCSGYPLLLAPFPFLVSMI